METGDDFEQKQAKVGGGVGKGDRMLAVPVRNLSGRV